jgi:hypothetical protein
MSVTGLSYADKKEIVFGFFGYLGIASRREYVAMLAEFEQTGPGSGDEILFKDTTEVEKIINDLIGEGSIITNPDDPDEIIATTSSAIGSFGYHMVSG